MKTHTRILTLAALALGASSLAAQPLMKIGEAELHFVGSLSIVYEDNVFLTSTDEESDMRFEFTPGFELRSGSDAGQTILRYQHRFTMYDDLSELDADFADASFSTNYNSGIVMTSFSVRYREDYSSSYGFDDSSDIFGVLIRRDTLNVNGSLKYEISELTAVKGGMEFSDTNYDDIVEDGEVVRSFTDTESYSIPVTFYYRVKPKVDLTAGMRYRNTDASNNIEYEDLYYYVGAVGELFSPVVYADLTIGYQKRDANVAALDSDSASYDLRLIYTGNPKATVNVGVSRDFRTSADGGNSYAFTSGYVSGTYSLSPTFGLNAALAIGESEYEQSPRAEDITMFSLGASYRPNDYLTVNAAYSYRDVDGNVANYTDGEFRVTASLRY